jgi:galactarate dehydratase
MIKVHADDNVAVALEPVARKVAAASIAAGEAVRRYGQVIGYAVRAIEPGEKVGEDDLTLPAPPSLEQLVMDGPAPPMLRPIDGVTFDGFENADGTAGTRNLLGISTTVQCVAATVEIAASRIRDEILPRFANVDGVIALTHPYGCGVAIDAPGAEIPIRTLRNLALNPNFGGEVMAVSLGCEKLQPSRLFPLLEGEPWVVRLQDEEYRSFGDMVAEIMRFAEKRLERLNRRRRTACPASMLRVGLQCGGSDAFSGVTANPAVGHAADLLVRAGATVYFSEVTEVRDAVHLLAPRCATPEVARALIREMAWYDAYLARGGADRSANPTPGNKRGGLANIVEKALGSAAKSGTAPIAGVVAPGERATVPGLNFVATPASDFICGTLQLAAGMNVHVFTTGEGTPYGLAMAPVIKVSSRTALAERWPDLIDVDAGRIATGRATVEDVGRELFEHVLDAASGRRRPCAERLRLHNHLALFNPAPVT